MLVDLAHGRLICPNVLSMPRGRIFDFDYTSGVIGVIRGISDLDSSWQRSSYTHFAFPRRFSIETRCAEHRHHTFTGTRRILRSNTCGFFGDFRPLDQSVAGVASSTINFNRLVTS